MAIATDSGTMNFDDAPGNGFSLDDIFLTDDNPKPPTTQVADPNPPEPQTLEPLLKTSTGTVYNTVDDAVKGIEHKDVLITQLRQQLLDATNVDPLKKTPTVTTIPSYSEKPEAYFEDLKKAKTEQEVLSVQARFINEQLSPYAPIIASMVKSQAVDKVVSEVPTFREFLGSDNYKQTLESFPLLKQSIAISESNPNMSGDLPQLYRMAFDASAGRNVPRTVQSGTITPPVVQTRPTVSSTPVTPPTVTTPAPMMTTSKGRQEIINEQLARGVENLRF